MVPSLVAHEECFRWISPLIFFRFSKIWYMVWSRDSRCTKTLKVMRSKVKAMTENQDPSRVKSVILLWYVNESRFTVYHSRWKRACVDDTLLCWWQFVSLVRQLIQSCRLESRQWLLVLSGVNSVNTNDCVVAYCDLGWQVFWGAPNWRL